MIVRLGKRYWDGKGLEKDSDKAKQLWREAYEEMGDAQSAAWLDWLYQQGLSVERAKITTDDVHALPQPESSSELAADYYDERSKL